MKNTHNQIAIQEYCLSIGSNANERLVLGELRLTFAKVPLLVYEQRRRSIKAKFISNNKHPFIELVSENGHIYGVGILFSFVPFLYKFYLHRRSNTITAGVIASPPASGEICLKI